MMMSNLTKLLATVSSPTEPGSLAAATAINAHVNDDLDCPFTAKVNDAYEDGVDLTGEEEAQALHNSSYSAMAGAGAFKSAAAAQDAMSAIERQLLIDDLVWTGDGNGTIRAENANAFDEPLWDPDEIWGFQEGDDSQEDADGPDWDMMM